MYTQAGTYALLGALAARVESARRRPTHDGMVNYPVTRAMRLPLVGPLLRARAAGKAARVSPVWTCPCPDCGDPI